jgi:hypothetical protein
MTFVFKDVTLWKVNVRDANIYTIYFNLENNPVKYQLSVKENNNRWELFNTINHTFGSNRCPYCKNRLNFSIACDFLNENSDEIFEKIKEHPSIRLDLLFPE